MAGLLKAPKTDVRERIERLLQEQRELEQQLQQFKSQQALGNVEALVQGATRIENVSVVASYVADTDRDGLRRLVDEIKNRLRSGVVALAAASGNEVAFVVGVTSDLVKDRGLHAGKIISELTQLADGRGGGRPELAQGGGKNPNKVDAAIDAAGEIVKKQLQT